MAFEILAYLALYCIVSQVGFCQFFSIVEFCLLFWMLFAHVNMCDRLYTKMNALPQRVCFPSAFYFIVNYQRYYILTYLTS